MAEPKQNAIHHDGWTENVEETLGHVALQEEHELTVLQAIRRYPKVFLWCLFAQFATLLVSFENQAAGNVLSIPKFREDFGHYYEGSYVLYTSWQSAFYGGPLAATIIATLGASAVSDRFGRKPTLIGAVIVSFAAIALEFVATTNPQFFGGKFLNGFTTGIIWSVAMVYVGEVSRLPSDGDAKPGVLTRTACTASAARIPYLSQCHDVHHRASCGGNHRLFHRYLRDPLGLPLRLCLPCVTRLHPVVRSRC